MNIFKKISLGTIGLLLTSSLVQASFDIVNDGQGYYGNAQTKVFHDAITGSESLNLMDRTNLAKDAPLGMSERGFIRLLLGKPRVKLANLQNKSNALINVPLNPIRDNLFQLWLVSGYQWEQWSAQLMLLGSKKLLQNDNYLVGGLPASLTTKVNDYGLFFNIEYILPHWFEFYPRCVQIYTNAGVGPVSKMTNFILTNPGMSAISSSKRKISAGGNLNLGIRYQFLENMTFDMAYHYTYLGKVTFGPQDGVNFGTTKFRSSGLFFGLSYLF